MEKLLAIVKIMVLPKSLRFLCLGLLLFASLLLLFQTYWGQPYQVVVGALERVQGGATCTGYIAVPGPETVVTHITASALIARQLDTFDPETEYLMVLRRRGDKVFFDRIYPLAAPDHGELQGPNWSHVSGLGLAMGTAPELVEMKGLDWYGYSLRLPFWAREVLAGHDRVYFVDGQSQLLRNMLEGGETEFVPDLYVLDQQGRVRWVRRTEPGLMTVTGFARQAALWLYWGAALAAVGALVSHYHHGLGRKGRRILDQVSMRCLKRQS